MIRANGKNSVWTMRAERVLAGVEFDETAQMLTIRTKGFKN